MAKFYIYEKSYDISPDGVKRAFEILISKMAQYMVLSKEAKKACIENMIELYRAMYQLVKYWDSYNLSEKERDEILKLVENYKKMAIKNGLFKYLEDSIVK